MARNSFVLFTQTPLFPVRTSKGRHWKGHVFNVYDPVRSKYSFPRNQILQNFTQRKYLCRRRTVSVCKWFSYVISCFIPSFICYPVTDSIIHSHTHTRIHSFTHPFTHTNTHTHTHTHKLIHSPIHIYRHSLTHSRTHALTHALIHSLGCSVTHSLPFPTSS